MAEAPATPALPPWPNVDFAQFGAVESKPLPRMQALTAGFLTRNWTMIPHVTHNDEVDVTAFEERRQAWNAAGKPKLTPLVPLMKAVAAALAAFPAFNSSLDPTGKTQIWKKYFHIGVAAETPNGLLVPVIRDVDSKDLATLAAEIGAKVEQARTKGLPMSEMSGGCFSITSLGHLGGTGFTPIINAPEVAILGVTKTQLRAAPGENGQVVWRRMLPLSLSYDHRVINGADAARFVSFIGTRLADPALLDG